MTIFKNLTFYKFFLKKKSSLETKLHPSLEIILKPNNNFFVHGVHK